MERGSIGAGVAMALTMGGAALAQPTAEIEISCQWGGSFQWLPITATLRVHNPGATSIAVVRGSLQVTTNAGLAAGQVQGFSSQFSGPPTNLGVFSGLSRTGMSIGGLPGVYPSGTHLIRIRSTPRARRSRSGRRIGARRG